MAQALKDVMTTRVVTVEPDTTVDRALRKMPEDDIAALVVEDRCRVEELVMDRDIVVRAVDTTREHAVRRIPVVEDGHAVGILSIGDLAIERDEDSALADINAAPPTSC